MPNIRCPHCNIVISDRSSKCPHCGTQIPMSVRYPNFYENKPNNYDDNKINDFTDRTTQSRPTTKPQTQYSAPPVQSMSNSHTASCPKCGSTNITYQREQTASFGAGTNKVVIQKEKKSKGCLYWMVIGWWWVPIYWLLIGWWWRPLFGGRTKGGLNFNANKTINRTMAICQNCGNSWKV